MMSTMNKEKEWLRRMRGTECSEDKDKGKEDKPVAVESSEKKEAVKKTVRGNGFADIAGMNVCCYVWHQSAIYVVLWSGRLRQDVFCGENG